MVNYVSALVPSLVIGIVGLLMEVDPMFMMAFSLGLLIISKALFDIIDHYVDDNPLLTLALCVLGGGVASLFALALYTIGEY